MLGREHNPNRSKHQSLYLAFPRQATELKPGQSSPPERVRLQPLLFQPGTEWNYSEPVATTTGNPRARNAGAARTPGTTSEIRGRLRRA